MEWIEPVNVKTDVHFSTSISTLENQENDTIFSGLFSECDLAWFACGNQLDILSLTRQMVQSKTFECTQGQEFQVTCATAIPDQPLILVGLSTTNGAGAVALYNYSTSLILNSWSIAHKVTCICTVEASNSSYGKLFKTGCLLFGIGTEEGHVMLLVIDQQLKSGEGSHRLDLQMVHYITTDDALNRRAFVKSPSVLLIPLNDIMYRAGRFILEPMQESQETLNVRQEDVAVSTIKYVPQSQTLCVGYNIHGAFQMYSLKSLDLDFSGFAQTFIGEQLGCILDFCFLEPEDDPRHFCYVFVLAEKCYGSRVAPFAVLYSLTFVHKESSSNGMLLYEELQYITPRFEIDFVSLLLTDDSHHAHEQMKWIACESLPSSFPINMDVSSKISHVHGLCCTTLEWANAVYFSVFDLNQWYQAQMPSRWIFDDMANLCPFMGFYRATMKLGSICQTWIKQSTLSIFHRSSVVNPAEQYFYPSALSFHVGVITSSERSTINFLGFQSLLLNKLSHLGSAALNQPHRLYVQAIKAGLLSSEVTTVAPNISQMAEAILDIALENNCRAFLVACIKEEGANLNFVEKWAWQQVLRLKNKREALCLTLFDHSVQELESQLHGQLYHVTHQLNNLSVLYQTMDEKIRSLNSGINDKLRDKSRSVDLLSLHLQTVLWFLHGGLLPEVDEDISDSNCLPYPRQRLEEFYRRRKVEIESLSSSIKSGEVLLIEELVPDSVRELWTKEGGSVERAYPPPSLYSLLSSYLRPDVDDVTKHRLVQYVFLDLTWIYGRYTHFGNILQHLVTFPSTYSLSPSVIKITQAFWHLDHQNFDDALSMLLDPLVNVMDITNTQQRAILRSFLYQDQRMHALKYATQRQPVCPELEDIQLHLTILIANNLIGDALGYFRRNRNVHNSRDLMQHLLCGCQEMKKVNVLLTLPLTDQEEEEVTNFLRQSKNVDLQEALLLYYIQRCKYPEAIAYSERLNKLWPARDAASRERFNRRNLLVQTLTNALPAITCKLAAIATSRSGSVVKETKYPQPLSVTVLPSKSKVLYSDSAFFRTVMEQSRTTWITEQERHQEVQTPLRSRKRKIEEPEKAEIVPEGTPFLSNIVQSAKKNISLGTTLTFPSPKGQISTMDVTGIETETDSRRQIKRPRYSLFPKPSLSSKADDEIVCVLNTPPINRVRRSTVEIGSSNQPSSILKDKMRRFINYSLGQSDEQRGLYSGPESEPELEGMETPKHLRFNLPKRPSLDVTEAKILSTEADQEEEFDLGNVSKALSDTPVEEFMSFEEEKEESQPQTPKSVPASTPSGILTTSVIETAKSATLSGINETVNVEEPMEITTVKPVAYETNDVSMAITMCEPYVDHSVISSPSTGITKADDQEETDESDIVCLDSDDDDDGEVAKRVEIDHVEEQSEEGEEEEQFEEEEEEVDDDAEEELEQTNYTRSSYYSKQRISFSSSSAGSSGSDVEETEVDEVQNQLKERGKEYHQHDDDLYQYSTQVEAGEYEEAPDEYDETAFQTNEAPDEREIEEYVSQTEEMRDQVVQQEEAECHSETEIEKDLEEVNEDEEEDLGTEQFNEMKAETKEIEVSDSSIETSDQSKSAAVEEEVNKDDNYEEEQDVDEVVPKMTDSNRYVSYRTKERINFSSSSSEDSSDGREQPTESLEHQSDEEKEGMVTEVKESMTIEISRDVDNTKVIREERTSRFYKSRLQLSDIEFSDESSNETGIEENRDLAAAEQFAEKLETEEEQYEASIVEGDERDDVEDRVTENISAHADEIETTSRDETASDVKSSIVEGEDVSLQYDGSSTDENEDLKDILKRHDFVGLSIPDTVVPANVVELSTIVEEKEYEHSALIENSREKTDESNESVKQIRPSENLSCEFGEIEEAVEQDTPVEMVNSEIEEHEEELVLRIEKDDEIDEAEDKDVPDSNPDELDAAILETGSKDMLDFEDKEEQNPASEVRTRRSRSLRSSYVLLPFTSRYSSWRTERDKSPDSVTSEPPPSISEAVEVSTKPRRRRHSETSSVKLRRSTRLSSSEQIETEPSDSKQTTHTPKKYKKPTGSKEETVPNISVSPEPISENKKLTKIAAKSDETTIANVQNKTLELEESIIETAPADTSFPGQSAPGTPIRRSARIALREKTPEPSACVDESLFVNRKRRHSVGTICPITSSPSQKLGKKSGRNSRETSPDSVVSEPPPVTTGTPKGKKSTRSSRTLRKAENINLLPVVEESEASIPATPEKFKGKAVKGQEESPNSEDDISSQKDFGKANRSSTSSPSSSRYNLRRTRRVSDLEMISEEESRPEAAVKRILDEDSSSSEKSPSSKSEISSESGPSTGRATRSKRKKVDGDSAAQETEQLHFIRRLRPPENLPKRDPAIKTRRGSRRSMRLD